MSLQNKTQIKKLNTHHIPGQGVREGVKNWELEYHFSNKNFKNT